MIPAVLQGRDCTDKGIIKQATAGSWGLALSRGLDSPAKKQDPNEDSCGVVVGTACSVAVVADAHFGQSAAELAVEHLLMLAKTDLLQGTPTVDRAEWITAALKETNRWVWSAPGPSACALLVVWVHHRSLWWGSVGDCRLYLVRDNHSQVLNPLHGRYVGDRRWVSVTKGMHALCAGDRLVLASDGLPECRYGRETLGAADVSAAVKSLDARTGVRALVRRAFQGGGEDNVAVVMCVID